MIEKLDDYLKAAVVVEEVASQLLDRLQWMTLQPNIIVNLGAATSFCNDLLSYQYPNASLIAIAEDEKLIQQTKYLSTQAPPNWLGSTVENLPIASHSVDLVVANWVLPWCRDKAALLSEGWRILRPGGLFIFSSLGLDTLKGQDHAIIPRFLDMHNLGDMLLEAKLADPVLDVDYLSVEYQSPIGLIEELAVTSMLDLTEFNEHDKKEQFVAAFQTATNNWQVPYEIIYGHAWGTGFKPEQPLDASGEAKFPLAYLRRRS